MEKNFYDELVFLREKSDREYRRRVRILSVDSTKSYIVLSVFVISIIFFQLLLRLIFDSFNISSELSFAIRMFLMYFILFIFLIAFLKSELSAEIELFKQKKLWLAVIPIFVWFFSMFFMPYVYFTLKLINGFFKFNSKYLNGVDLIVFRTVQSSWTAAILIILATVVFAPFVNEIIFRKIIFGNLQQSRFQLAFSLSILLYGLFHFILSGDWSAIVIFSVMGVFYTLAYVYGKCIYVPVIMNYIQTIFLFLVLLRWL